MRTDRTPGNRGAFEAARQKILKTQTVCGICGKPVDFSYKAPHPLSPTVDHIIPVSKGGHPSDISNLQLAHRCCNRQKSDSLIEPRKVEESDKTLPNDILEQHAIWADFRYGGG
jgi:5-methylcytosine-specific restriction endonuclease McrA